MPMVRVSNGGTLSAIDIAGSFTDLTIGDYYIVFGSRNDTSAITNFSVASGADTISTSNNFRGGGVSAQAILVKATATSMTLNIGSTVTRLLIHIA